MTTPEGDLRDARLATDGDTRAFERLYRGHVARVHGLARRMVGHEEADELTQDVFVRAWERLETFRGEAAFGTWIHRVAINVMLARQASRRRERGRFEDDDARIDSAPAVPREAESRIDLEAALTNLPEGARRVFVLHDMEGYKHHEIAELLDITVGTSKSQLHRARLLMREQLVV
ncbi:MAG TPA: RNA polymerase sigma factor [Gemmatimonadota bacterium]|jgi:RNA polymerase sigma-70 factor (ECF subfamily)